MQVPISKVKTYKETILALEDVQTFLESRGHLHDSSKIGIAVDSLASLHLAPMTQKTAQFLLLNYSQYHITAHHYFNHQLFEYQLC